MSDQETAAAVQLTAAQLIRPEAAKILAAGLGARTVAVEKLARNVLCLADAIETGRAPEVPPGPPVVVV